MSKERHLSDDHKAALAEGRQQGKAVRAYLNALESNKPKRGRKRTPESIKNRLEKIESGLPSAGAVDRLQLIQERIDLQGELAGFESQTEIIDSEPDFIAAAAAYSERKGISYAAWREIGVPAPVLKSAGVRRTRSS